jgi:glycosyltransferase involved in cell wall biosynthesis
MADVNGDTQLAETAAATRTQELALMQKVDVTLVVSPVERDIIAEHDPDLQVEVLSNIHETHDPGINFQERHDVLFIGGFNHPPNTDAVLYYVREILPQVERELGDIKTFIVGSKPPREIIDLASDTLIVTGHVPDVAPYFAHCRLSIAPLRYGAGVKGKINTSMCYGVPVVATPLAVEGMYLSDGEDVLVGDDAESFARCVVRLYRDADLWHRLARNGLLNIEKHFSTTAAKKVLEKIFRDRGVLP